jgi:GxxExxY protein
VHINNVTGNIIDSALRVHRELGPGLLESAYAACLTHELICRGLRVEREKPLHVLYDGVRIDVGYRLDMLVDERVIVEVKSVTRLAPIHTAQMLTYLRLARCEVGILINFNEILLKNGLKRLVNGYAGPTPRPPRTPR